jgi:hypothetical protein
MREVYQIYDSEAKKVDGIIRGDKQNALNEVKRKNRIHAENTVQEILGLKSPKRGDGKVKVAELTLSIADGRYSLKTDRIHY